jgi:hypothetical protein
MPESFKLYPGKSYDEEPEKLPDGVNYAEEVLFRALEIRKYIGMLKGTISKNAYAAAQALVRGYSENELALQIWQSNENDWKQKPAFYSELCDAYYSKIKSRS